MFAEAHTPRSIQPLLDLDARAPQARPDIGSRDLPELIAVANGVVVGYHTSLHTAENRFQPVRFIQAAMGIDRLCRLVRESLLPLGQILVFQIGIRLFQRGRASDSQALD